MNVSSMLLPPKKIDNMLLNVEIPDDFNI